MSENAPGAPMSDNAAAPVQPARENAPVPPVSRTATHVELTVAALQGAFRLQRAAGEERFFYPPREVAPETLSPELIWEDVERSGTVLATTRIHVPSSEYFRQRSPWPIALIASAAGPSIIAHALDDLAPDDPVRLALRIDRAGRAVVVAESARAGAGAAAGRSAGLLASARDRADVAESARTGAGATAGRGAEFLASARGALLSVSGGGAHTALLVRAALAAGAERISVDREAHAALGDLVDDRIVRDDPAPENAWPLRTDFS